MNVAASRVHRPERGYGEIQARFEASREGPGPAPAAGYGHSRSRAQTSDGVVDTVFP